MDFSSKAVVWLNEGFLHSKLKYSNLKHWNVKLKCWILYEIYLRNRQNKMHTLVHLLCWSEWDQLSCRFKSLIVELFWNLMTNNTLLILQTWHLFHTKKKRMESVTGRRISNNCSVKDNFFCSKMGLSTKQTQRFSKMKPTKFNWTLNV